MFGGGDVRRKEVFVKWYVEYCGSCEVDYRVLMVSS